MSNFIPMLPIKENESSKDILLNLYFLTFAIAVLHLDL